MAIAARHIFFCLVVVFLSIIYMQQHNEFEPDYNLRLSHKCTSSTAYPFWLLHKGRQTWKLQFMLVIDDDNGTILTNQLLTKSGYIELAAADVLGKNQNFGKCIFIKKRLNIHLFLMFLWWPDEGIKKKIHSHVLRVLKWFYFCESKVMDFVGYGLYNYSLILFYFLLTSGIESNPGPPKQNRPERKRVRKSGLTYCNYLTDRDNLENAPTYMKRMLHRAPDSQIQSHSSTTEDDPCISNNEMEYEASDNDGIHSDFSSDDNLLSTPSDSSACSSDEDTDNHNNYFTPDQDEETNLDNMPVYEGARISTGASMLLHITFALEQNLTGNGLCQLLNLTEIHCKENNTIPTSLHIFKKWFKNLKVPPKKHMYCSACLFSVDKDSEKCPNPSCELSFTNSENKCHFVEISLLNQLQKLFYSKSFREQILFRFHRKKINDDNIEDIYDGKIYKSHKELFSDPNSISLIWNTDGIPLFKSSKVSMWPLYFAINELPYKLRRKPENLILAGLWIGPTKPQMLTFLKPFIDDLHLLENGIKVDTDEQQTIEVKGILIAGTADLPAKCAVCNMVQYNGKYSCPHCTQSGKTAASGKGRCHVFPFNFENPLGPKRSNEECLEMAHMASDTGNPVFGIKGPCWFSTLKHYDFVLGNGIDYMHCVLLGVMKRLTTFWFTKDFVGQRFNFYQSVDKINEKIKQLKPPLTIHRMPRSINDLKLWKASEFRSFLLFYAPVLLNEILPQEYYKHFLLLSNSIFLLLKESIDPNEIDAVENYLEHFVARYSDLYEERFLTLNVHLLLHLPDNVRQLGPLWAYSCFPFEDANGYLLKLVKGTQTVESQITDTLAIIHGIPLLENECVKAGSREEEILYQMKNMSLNNAKDIGNETFALGKVTYKEAYQLPQDLYVAIANFLQKPLQGSVNIFKRVKKGSKIYHSLEYIRAKVRNSYTIRYIIAGKTYYGLVKTYVQYTELHSKRNLAIVLPLTTINDDSDTFPFDEITQQKLMAHFVTCNMIDYANVQPLAVEISNILDMCVMLQVKDKDRVYLCCTPNLLEKD